MNLKSDLSWYGKKPGFAKKAEDIASRKTGYLYNDDLTVQTYVSGFDNNGFAKFFIPRLSADTFAIDDVSHSFRGTSSRKTQQGGGSKFPIGPKGQVHDFDIPRLGFHIDNRYGNTYNAKSLSGLAATYTKNSPIDDVYNIVKVRDVSYDPFGYASPPYILRGIQRDDNRYPQRWGTGNQIADTVSLALGVPRGGALAFGERAANDVARLAKMMIRPMGLGWIAKQALLHLMNPNTEGVYGLIQRPNNHKFSNPINTLLAAGLSGLGIHPRKHGLLPVGGLGRYEDIINTRNTLEIFTPGPIGQFNRLRRLTNELYNHYQLPVLPYWNTITGITGPDTVGGIGVTQFSRDVQGNLDQLLRFPGAQTSGQFTNGIQNTINTLTPLQYLRIRKTDDSKYGNQGFATGVEGSRSPLMFTQYSVIPGTYGYGRDLLFDRKEFPVVRGIADPRVFFVTKGTRPDTSSTGWEISIPRLTTKFRSTSGIRTNDKAPLNLVPVPLEELTAYTDLFRSQFNPYNWSNAAGGGIFNAEGKTQLEARYTNGVSLPGMPNDEMNDRPSNRFTLSSVRRPTKVDISGKGNHTIQDKPIADLAKDYKNIVPYRGIVRTNETPYGNPGELGYGDGNDNAGASLNTGEKSNLVINQESIKLNGLNPGNDQIGKRLVDPKEDGRTEGAGLDGIALTGIRAYKTMTYPAIYKAAARSLSTDPTTFDFTTGANWTAAESPMAKAKGSPVATKNDQHRKDTWDLEDASKHPINITIGGQIFPAYITDISTKTDQSLLTFKPAGSPIAVLAGAQNFSTGVSISFIVAARSKEEYNSLWTSLSSLQGKVRPTVAAAVWSPEKCALTVGDFINITNSYLTSISLALDNEYPWGLGGKKPMYINVDCQFEVINGSGVYA